MIYIEDTQIKVGSRYLPGLLKSIDITGDARVEEQEIQGSSTKKKQAMGYEDPKITIELLLVDGVYESRYEKLAELQAIFREAGQDKPAVHTIVSRHLATRGLSRVLLKSLQSREDNAKSQIIATLTFWGYEAMTLTASKAPAKPAGPAGPTAPKAVDRQKTRMPSTTSGYIRGAAPKLTASRKEEVSPAKDTAETKSKVKKARGASTGGNHG